MAAGRIESGNIITREMVAVKGPGQGLSPQRYTELIGRTAERIIEADEPFLDRDLGQIITLDVEHTLPMQWGFVVRFNDFCDVLKHNPPLLEFHFTDKDLDDEYPGDDLDSQLVVHAPEFWLIYVPLKRVTGRPQWRSCKDRFISPMRWRLISVVPRR